MIQVVNRHGFDYNIVEAFNQPWKSNLEGVVGANWGLFSAKRTPVFPLTGPVLENPDWPLQVAAAVAMGLWVLAFYFKRLLPLSWLPILLFLSMAQLFSICLIDLADFLWYTSYSTLQRAYTVFIVGANLLLGHFLLQRYADLLTASQDDTRLAQRLRQAYLVFIALALYKTFGLAFNGRYLSFPIEQFALPVLGIMGLIVGQWLKNRQLNAGLLSFDGLSGGQLQGPRDRLLAYGLVFGVLAMIGGETYAFMSGRDFIAAHPGLKEGLPVALGYTLFNKQLVSWLVCLILLSLPFWSHAKFKNIA